MVGAGSSGSLGIDESPVSFLEPNAELGRWRLFNTSLRMTFKLMQKNQALDTIYGARRHSL